MAGSGGFLQARSPTSSLLFRVCRDIKGIFFKFAIQALLCSIRD